MDPAVSLKAAERLFSSVEKGDLEALRDVFAPDAWVWHASDNKKMTVEHSIKSIRAIQRSASEYRYTEIKRQPTPEGFVQQHVLLIMLHTGHKIVDRACCVCGVKDGRIAFMEAYHDPSVFNVDGFGRRPTPLQAPSH
jgi:ketosteroid isomerase-like protein